MSEQVDFENDDRYFDDGRGEQHWLFQVISPGNSVEQLVTFSDTEMTVNREAIERAIARGTFTVQDIIKALEAAAEQFNKMVAKP